jgi:hypothetical protein
MNQPPQHAATDQAMNKHATLTKITGIMPM